AIDEDQALSVRVRIVERLGAQEPFGFLDVVVERRKPVEGFFHPGQVLLARRTRFSMRPQAFQGRDLLLHPLVALTAYGIAQAAVEDLNAEVPLDDVRDAFVLEEAGERRKTQVR